MRFVVFGSLNFMLGNCWILCSCLAIVGSLYVVGYVGIIRLSFVMLGPFVCIVLHVWIIIIIINLSFVLGVVF